MEKEYKEFIPFYKDDSIKMVLDDFKVQVVERDKMEITKVQGPGR